MGRFWLVLRIEGKGVARFRALKPYWCEAFSIEQCVDGGVILACSFKHRGRLRSFLPEILPTIRAVTAGHRGSVTVLRGYPLTK